MAMPTMPLTASAMQMNAAAPNATPSATSTAANAAAPSGGRRSSPSRSAPATSKIEKRTPAEVAEALKLLGCPTKGTQAELQRRLQEAEALVSRAKATRSARRREDPALLELLRDGNTPKGDAFIRMLESGADPNIVAKGGSGGVQAGVTPLLAAAAWGSLNEMRLLIAAGADVTATSPSNPGHTALHIVAGGNIEVWGEDKVQGMIRLLVHKNPELLTMKNHDGKNPSDWARSRQKSKTVKFLAEFS